MRPISCIIAVAALAGAVAGCAQPYPHYGYTQATYYSYPVATTAYFPEPPNYQEGERLFVAVGLLSELPGHPRRSRTDRTVTPDA